MFATLRELHEFPNVRVVVFSNGLPRILFTHLVPRANVLGEDAGTSNASLLSPVVLVNRLLRSIYAGAGASR